MAGYTGLSFPFRIGSKGRTVMSSANDIEIPHIVESIKQILLTRKGERVNEPEFGANLYNVLFENFDETVINVLAYKIQEALDIWEPRISVDNIIITELDGGVSVTVQFTVIKTLLKTETSVFLNKEANQ